ncbi:MAG TPA: T9SS type A sorting domain-containing protein [Bacteroidia bacterium]|nr:T9SS type A sorting domain-containing protein [Bacteroidia bacterium]
MKTKIILISVCLVICNFIYAQTWSTVGTGFYALDVYSIVEYNNDLYAGGWSMSINSVSAHRIAKWDGTNWSFVGTGVSGGNNSQLYVHALAVYNGELYAAGDFDSAGSFVANNIAKWNGTNWSPVGTGLGGSGAYVQALEVFNGELYVGGFFLTAGGNNAPYIAKWNGTNWSGVGLGMNSSVNAFEVYNGELYAGGFFTTAGGNPANYTAKWNGTIWSALSSTTSNVVYSLHAFGGDLYAAGVFSYAGGNPAGRIAKWNGTNWSSLGPGLNGNSASAICGYLGEIYAGGLFDSAGSVLVNNIAKWDGISWSAIDGGTSGHVSAFGIYYSELFVGGGIAYAGPTLVNGITKLNNLPTSSDIKFSSSMVTIYPNPATTEITVQSSKLKVQSVEVYDMLGQRIYNSSLISHNSSLSIDVSQWHTGIYFVKLLTGEKMVVKKVVKM